MSQSRDNSLGGILGGLSPDRAVQLAQALETERQSGGQTLPYDMILDGIRPALQRSKRALTRVMTPQRLLCVPFEDMLGHGGAAKHRGRIRRVSLAPIFDWLQTDLMPGEYDRLMEDTSAALVSGDDRLIEEAGRALHGVCGMVLSTALKEAVPGSGVYKAIAARLGSAEILEDARDMSMVLEIADDILAMLKDLPRPIDEIDDACFDAVRGTYETISDHLPDHACYVIFVTMGRLARPWDILSLIGRLTNRDTDKLIAQSDLSDCGALLMADLEQSVAFFKALDPAQLDLSELMHQLTYFTNLSQGITLALGITRDGEWGAEIAQARGVISGVMESVLETVVKEIRQSIPTQNGRGLGMGEVAFAVLPDPGLSLGAIERSGVVAQLRYLAEGAAFSGPYTSVVAKLIDDLNGYALGAFAAVEESVVSYGELKDDTAAARHGRFALELCQALIPAEEARVLAKRYALASQGQVDQDGQ